MTNSPKQNVFNPVRILTSGLGFVFFAVLCLLLSQGVFAETITVTGMNDATNYENKDIVDTLGKANYNHTGSISGTSSLTINAPENSSSYRQWLKGSYTFTGPIMVNSGQLLVQNGKLQSTSIDLNGGDMYVMYTDCLPHDAVVNVGEGSMLDVEGASNAIKGATINVSAGGSFRVASQNLNDSTTPVTLNIAGTGRPTSGGAYNARGAIAGYHDDADLHLTANINLTDNATIFLDHMSTGRQFILRGTLTGSSTLTLASDNKDRWITFHGGTDKLDISGFSGNFVVDCVRTRFWSDSLGTGSNITVQNSGTAFFNNTTALNNYTGSFTVNNGTITLEAAGKLNNLSGDANGKVDNGGNALTLNNTEDTSFSGVISGSGTVTKNGSGTLTLSGANTYAGATTISAGTLKLTGAGLSGTGAIANNATLEFAHDSDQTINAVISGSGTLKKTGSGTLTLAKANTYTGATTVSAGTLKLSGDGKLASSTIDVATGATMLYYNTVPHNTSALTINVNGGTLEFYNNTTTSATHNANIAICSGASGQGVTINGTGGTLLIDGGGCVAALNSNASTVKFALDANSVMYVKSGYFVNGGYATQNWDSNKAELKIGKTGKVELWDGKQMKVGGLSGEAGAQLVETKGGNGISVGNGVTSDKTFTYNGTINLNKKAFDYVGAGTQILNGNISNVIMSSKAGTLVLGTTGNEINIGSSSVIKTDSGAIRVDGNIIVNTSYFSASGSWTGNGSIKVNSGGVLRAAGTTFAFANGITLNGGLLFNDGDNYSSAKVTINAPITITEAGGSVQCGWSNNKSGEIHLDGGLNGSGALTVNKDSNMGWIYMTGAGNYTGTLILKGKIVTGPTGKGSEANPASTTPYLGSGEIRLDGGLLLNNSSYWDVPNKINVVSNSSIRAGYSRPFTFSGQITGSGTLTIENDNSWIIMKTSSPDNSFTGDVLVNYNKSDSLGRLQLAAEQPFGSNAGQANVLGTLDMNGFSQKFKGLSGDGTTGNINNNTAGKPLSTLTLDTTGKNSTYKGKINGNIALVINGTGTQTFANNGSSFTGNVVINGGTVSATAGHASYTTTALGAFSTPGGRTITVNSDAELVLGTNDVLGGCDPGNYNANAVRLIINGGKLSGSNNNALYNATFQNGAEVYGNNNRPTWQSFWLIGTNYISFAGDGESPEQPVQFNGASGVVFVLYESPVLNVADITLSDESDLVVNVIFGNKSSDPVSNNSLTKTGAGTVEFTKANAYTGGTTISKGALKFTDAAVVANGPITVGADGTLEYNLSSGQTKKLTITNASKIFSTGKVVKTGDGTLQICTESAGLVDATSFVVSSGRLDMKEYFTGSLAVEAGATLSPGNSVGTLTVDGTFSLDSGATLLMEVGKNDQGEIVVDQLILSEVNEETFASGSIINIVLDPDSGLVGGDSFTDLVFITTTSDADAARIFDAVNNATISYYFPGFEVKRDGNNIVLSGTLDANAIPEPSTWALLALGVVGLMYWRKRK